MNYLDKPSLDHSDPLVEKLKQQLATVYSTLEKAKEVVGQAGLKPEDFPVFQEAASMAQRWPTILDALAGRIDALDGRPLLRKLVEIAAADEISLDYKEEFQKHLQYEVIANKVTQIEIPFVIFAMTKDQAKELVSGTVFDPETVAPIEKKNFENVNAALKRIGLTDIVANYGSTPDEWRPHFADSKTMREVVEEMVSLVNKRRQKDSQPPIVAKFHSEEYLSSDSQILLDKHTELATNPFILILDAISMFHTSLRKDKLQPEQVAIHSGVWLVVISPSGNDEILKDITLPEREIGDKLWQQGYSLYNNFNLRYEFGIANNRVLGRWLASVVPQVAGKFNSESANPDTRSSFRNDQAKKGTISTGEKPF
jgi:hypothetical protein